MAEIRLTQVPEEDVTTGLFLGVDRHRRAAGRNRNDVPYTSLTECRNMTSEEYPCAMVRAPRVEIREKYALAPDHEPEIRYAPSDVRDAIYVGTTLAYLLADHTVMMGMRQWYNYLNPAAVSLGDARIYAFGHGIYSPKNNLYVPDTGSTDWEPVDAHAAGTWRIDYCDETGKLYEIYPQSGTAPEAPEEGDIWYKTGENSGLFAWDGTAWVAATFNDGDYWYKTGDDGGWYRYDGTEQEWVSWPAYHIRLRPTGVSTAEYSKCSQFVRFLRAEDQVNVLSDTDGVESIGYADVIKVDKSEPWFVLKTLHEPCEARMTAGRRAPVSDYTVVHNNRIWSCRYGNNRDGAFVNEIFCCALGDPTNWYKHMGEADGAFYAGVGEEGPWTGAAVVGDHPVFFKENCMYTVYGDTPEDFCVVQTYCSGIQAGSDRSAVTVGGALYYLSPHGVMRLYSGTMPQQISDDLTYKNVLSHGIAGTDGRKYWLQATDVSADPDKDRMYVYDTELQEWHIEAAVPHAVCLVPFANELLCVTSKGYRTPVYGRSVASIGHLYVSPPGAGVLRQHEIPERPIYLYYINETDETLSMPGDLAQQAVVWYETEQGPEWAFATGDFGHEIQAYKRVKSVGVRAWMEQGADFAISIMYDEDGQWHELERSDAIRAEHTGTTEVRYPLRRCDVFRLRFAGRGRVCIYSITTTYEGEGDRSYGTN